MKQELVTIKPCPGLRGAVERGGVHGRGYSLRTGLDHRQDAVCWSASSLLSYLLSSLLSSLLASLLSSPLSSLLASLLASLLSSLLASLLSFLLSSHAPQGFT